MSEARPTFASELLVIAFQALSSDEQDEAYELITDARAARQAAEGSATGLMLRSLQIVAAEVGTEPTIEQYRKSYTRLKEDCE